MSFQKILDKYRKISFNERDKGDRFERLMQAYLKTDPKYAHRFSKVWLWNEFPGKSDLGGSDTGIDLVALTIDGDYWAIQCKCYQENAVIDKASVDSFLSTSSREFKNESLQTCGFSQRLWISTTNKWGSNATEAIRNQNPPVIRINLFDLIEAPVDWEKLENGIHGEASRTQKKSLRKHQKEAVDLAHEYFKDKDRGKLIMACGTGKTFTSLRIAEHETDGKGLILFMVPSIALLGQTLREWSADANEPINPICICSDAQISKKKELNEDGESFSTIDLAYPASTNITDILYQFERIRLNKLKGMTVVFSTYQSIEVIAQAQVALLRNGFPPFDLIICDEAHRTTGAQLPGLDESNFVRIHNNGYVVAKKRLYMTATPRMYDDNTKSKAAQNEVPVWSMDEPEHFGDEIYRIGFGAAVDEGLLTDYKVLILALSDKDVPASVQKMITSDEEINTDDASKLIGCINALSKQFIGDDGKTKESDPNPMKRAVAFCQNIKISKQITHTYNATSDIYLDTIPNEKRDEMVSIESKHIDGSMSAPARDELLGWLKAPTEGNDCRVLTNVRCLSEGVDVPSLDAVLFLSARNSQVDVVQSVGRVMRRSEGKNYGYIIIPVVVPSDVEPETALDNNDRYRVVWTVLNALRAHDDRFNATINKIDLNKKRPGQILIGRPAHGYDEDGEYYVSGGSQANEAKEHDNFGRQMALQFEQLQSIVYAKMVQKVGDKRYWEQWAKDVAKIAERQIERIKYQIAQHPEQRNAFDNFLGGLQKNINPSITEAQAVDMLAQHIITKPIFEALFEGYSFVKSNAVSTAMQGMLDALQGDSVADESETLQRFYESVRKRAEGIDNAEGKQRIIIELYDKFFKTAFPKMVEQLGIVYTPVEVVDFIIHSVNDVLKQEFGRSVSDENVHILDPFTGTGTFITRLLQSGLIDSKDLERKYKQELHANEIVLLAYYIAAVNIENAYHDQLEAEKEYEPFDGIVLTDTFQLGETDESEKLFSEMFPQNSARVQAQKKAPVRVIMGNPPYSVGQKSANDNAQNLKYEKLDDRISKTYAKATEATNKNSLYDSYIKAFRWSTDRLDSKHGGVIAFVSNGAWIDGNSSDGFRKTIEKEFSSIWVFNLRGNQRTSGELSRQEGGKIFGSGSRTPIAITLLVKNPLSKSEKASIHYHDIGDYLNQKEKLDIIQRFNSVGNDEMNWKILEPNEQGDWISQRNEVFDTFLPIGNKGDGGKNAFFNSQYSRGLATARDAYCYNSSLGEIKKTIDDFINFYEKERREFHNAKQKKEGLTIEDFLDFETNKVTWNRGLKNDINRNHKIEFSDKCLRQGLYRPFFKQHLYLAKELNDMIYQIPKLFPTQFHSNAVICVSGLGGSKENTVLMTDLIPDLNCLDSGTQCFPLNFFEERDKNNPGLFDVEGEAEFIKRDGVSDFILERAKKQYGKNVSKEDIFYYVYGLLHSPDYRIAFANDLKKMLPRIPLVEDVRDFWKFSKAGRQLADLHIGYEDVPSYEGVQVSGEDSGFYRVEKMRFPKKGQKDTIIYNSKIIISNIPEKAYEYVVNGKSAIEWIMERYQVTVHKDSGIKNDPNDWSAEVGNPRYILDLLLSIISVSMQTVDIVEGLPKLEFE